MGNLGELSEHDGPSLIMGKIRLRIFRSKRGDREVWNIQDGPTRLVGYVSTLLVCLTRAEALRHTVVLFDDAVPQLRMRRGAYSPCQVRYLMYRSYECIPPGRRNSSILPCGALDTECMTIHSWLHPLQRNAPTLLLCCARKSIMHARHT